MDLLRVRASGNFAATSLEPWTPRTASSRGALRRRLAADILNKQIFADNGIPRLPPLGGFIAMCQTLKDNGVDGLRQRHRLQRDILECVIMA